MAYHPAMWQITSMTETALLFLSYIAAFACASLAARYPASRMKAVGLGILTGLVTAITLSFLIGLLGWVVPLGQVDFWIARLLFPGSQ